MPLSLSFYVCSALCAFVCLLEVYFGVGNTRKEIVWHKQSRHSTLMLTSSPKKEMFPLEFLYFFRRTFLCVCVVRGDWWPLSVPLLQNRSNSRLVSYHWDTTTNPATTVCLFFTLNSREFVFTFNCSGNKKPLENNNSTFTLETKSRTSWQIFCFSICDILYTHFYFFSFYSFYYSGISDNKI